MFVKLYSQKGLFLQACDIPKSKLSISINFREHTVTNTLIESDTCIHYYIPGTHVHNNNNIATVKEKHVH